MKYNLILADPAWQQKKGGLRKNRPMQGRELDYKTISNDEIKNILKKATDLCTDDCVLFLWTIDKFLFQAQDIAESLGYKLHARMIWDKKNGVAPAFTIRYGHEYLLFMYKGKMLKVCDSERGKILTVFSEKATKHSKKPLSSYSIIERLYPNSKKIELFARNQRNGWDVFGDEVENSIQLI